MKQAVIYYTKIDASMKGKKLEHMYGEALLSVGLSREYHRELRFAPRDRGEHGKPFFTLEPSIHYNISHSGSYILCAFANQEVGVDVQEHRPVDYERLLTRLVPEERRKEILSQEDPTEEFYREWVLREAYLKWTGEGLSRELRSIPTDHGCGQTFPLEAGYSAALWSQELLELSLVEVPGKTLIEVFPR